MNYRVIAAVLFFLMLLASAGIGIYFLVSNIFSGINTFSENNNQLAFFFPEEEEELDYHFLIPGASKSIEEADYQYQLIDYPLDYNTYRPGRVAGASAEISGGDNFLAFDEINAMSLPVLQETLDFRDNFRSLGDRNIYCLTNCQSFSQLIVNDILVFERGEVNVYFRYVSSIEIVGDDSEDIDETTMETEAGLLIAVPQNNSYSIYLFSPVV
jgi:hypothetical protein